MDKNNAVDIDLMLIDEVDFYFTFTKTTAHNGASLNITWENYVNDDKSRAQYLSLAIEKILNKCQKENMKP